MWYILGESRSCLWDASQFGTGFDGYQKEHHVYVALANAWPKGHSYRHAKSCYHNKSVEALVARGTVLCTSTEVEILDVHGQSNNTVSLIATIFNSLDIKIHEKTACNIENTS